MAFKVTNITEGTIEVILRQDEALAADLTDKEFEAYFDTLDESKLRLKEGKQPTRFVLRKVLGYKVSQKLKNQSVSIQGKKTKVSASFLAEEVRLALCGIKNPPGETGCLEYKAAGDGGATDLVIAVLEAGGAVDQLFAARRMFLGRTATSDEVLKNG